MAQAAILLTPSRGNDGGGDDGGGDDGGGGGDGDGGDGRGQLFRARPFANSLPMNGCSFLTALMSPRTTSISGRRTTRCLGQVGGDDGGGDDGGGDGGDGDGDGGDGDGGGAGSDGRGQLFRARPSQIPCQ